MIIHLAHTFLIQRTADHLVECLLKSAYVVEMWEVVQFWKDLLK